MKPTYVLGIDAAKHKVRAALRGAEEERFLYEKDLPASAAGRRELLARKQPQYEGRHTKPSDKTEAGAAHKAFDR
jgi:hypothetical protein